MMNRVWLWGLWERKPTGGWVRLFPGLAYEKRVATQKFQDALLRHALVGDVPERRLIIVGSVIGRDR